MALSPEGPPTSRVIKLLGSANDLPFLCLHRLSWRYYVRIAPTNSLKAIGEGVFFSAQSFLPAKMVKSRAEKL